MAAAGRARGDGHAVNPWCTPVGAQPAAARLALSMLQGRCLALDLLCNMVGVALGNVAGRPCMPLVQATCGMRTAMPHNLPSATACPVIKCAGKVSRRLKYLHNSLPGTTASPMIKSASKVSRLLGCLHTTWLVLKQAGSGAGSRRCEGGSANQKVPAWAGGRFPTPTW